MSLYLLLSTILFRRSIPCTFANRPFTLSRQVNFSVDLSCSVVLIITADHSFVKLYFTEIIFILTSFIISSERNFFFYGSLPNKKECPPKRTPPFIVNHNTQLPNSFLMRLTSITIIFSSLTLPVGMSSQVRT